MKKTFLLSSTIVAMLIAALPARAEGDVANGEEIFEEFCSVCHQVGPDAEILVGPPLNNVIGRTAGTFEEFEYGESMLEAGEKGLVWDKDTIFEYLPDPSVYLATLLEDEEAESVMPPQFEEEQERLDVIAYIATFSDKE